MRIYTTGICGVAGSTLARTLWERFPSWTSIRIDNLSRPGGELNRSSLKMLGVGAIHGYLRNACDLEPLPDVDWIIDATP